MGARREDDRLAASGNDGGAHEDDIGKIGHGHRLICRSRSSHTLHREALARERGHADKEIAGRYQAGICRHDVSCLKMHDISCDNLGERQRDDALPCPLDRAERLDGACQGICRHAALALLDKAQDAGDQDHAADDEEGQRIPVFRRGKEHISRKGHERKKCEHTGEGIGKGLEEAEPLWVALLVAELVCAI